MFRSLWWNRKDFINQPPKLSFLIPGIDVAPSRALFRLRQNDVDTIVLDGIHGHIEDVHAAQSRHEFEANICLYDHDSTSASPMFGGWDRKCLCNLPVFDIAVAWIKGRDAQLTHQLVMSELSPLNRFCEGVANDRYVLSRRGQSVFLAGFLNVCVNVVGLDVANGHVTEDGAQPLATGGIESESDGGFLGGDFGEIARHEIVDGHLSDTGFLARTTFNLLKALVPGSVGFAICFAKGEPAFSIPLVSGVRRGDVEDGSVFFIPSWWVFFGRHRSKMEKLGWARLGGRRDCEGGP